MDFSTKAILEFFNVHDLRVIAAKLGQSDKYGRRSNQRFADRSITNMQKAPLIDIIANVSDIIIMTNPEQRADDDLNTDFILDKFNIGTLRNFVKHIGKQDEIKTFRRVEKGGKMVSENLNKLELMEKVKPYVRFGLIIKPEGQLKVPEIQKPAEQDELFNELDSQIKSYRESGMNKGDIIVKIKTALDDAYKNIMSNTELVNNPIYTAIKNKYSEIKKLGLTDEKDKVELRKYIREAKKYVKDLIDTKYEKLSLLAGSNIQELLSQREEERTAPKTRVRPYIKGGAPHMEPTIKPRGRPQTRPLEPKTDEIIKTKRELQREKRLAKELEYAREQEEKYINRQNKIAADEAKRAARAEKKQAKEESAAMKKLERENRKAARALANQ